MLAHLWLAVLPLLIGLTAQSDPNYAINGGFEEGLNGWTPSGNVSLEKTSPLEGNVSIRLGPGASSVNQRYKVPGLRIMWFGAKAAFSSAGMEAVVRVRCYDAHNRVVMELKEKFDSVKAHTKTGAEAGIYFKTQANTAYIIATIGKPHTAAGSVIVDAASIHDYDRNRKSHVPECDLDAYMEPIWNGKTVVDESVLFMSTNGAPATAKLLFNPTRILSVKDSALRSTYSEGIDFAVHKSEMRALPGGTIPSMRDSDFPKTAFPWLSIAGKHVFVTYEHDDRWDSPIPEYAASNLPLTTQKLRRRRPVIIAAYGDSITLGINVSGYREEPPYMPTWPELAQRQLQKNLGYDRIKMINASLGGMTADWARNNARDAVASLNPDLVIVAFGMNDFWSYSPEAFRDNIMSTVKAIRERAPRAEFVLVSSVRFDPAYTADPLYADKLPAYRQELIRLAGPGISVLDLTTLSDYLYRTKGAKSVLADPMHPDDFMARLFAQYLVRILTPQDLGKRVN